MKPSPVTLLAALTLVTVAAGAQPPAATCRTEPFRGASSAQGGTASMRVVNTGAACGFSNYGLPGSREHPADTGDVTRAPAHGKAVFSAPRIEYTPDPGYAGDDEFAYEASATGQLDQRVHLKVTVKVTVLAR